VRIATLLIVLALALSTVVLAIAGAARSDPIKLSIGRNGAIAYSVSDFDFASRRTTTSIS
jgi:hypothetical protein